MVQPGEPARALAARLRALRTGHWPETPLTQPVLATALGVSVPLISSWESQTDPKTPSRDRLADYARFFATARSLDGTRARLISNLTPAEEADREQLEAELIGLRSAIAPQIALGASTTAPPGGGLWHFADGAPVNIVCGSLPANLRADDKYTTQDSPDYVRLYNYADLDALVELYGHIHAANPTSQVSFRLASLVTEEHLTTHLVLLGGVDWNKYVPEVLDKLGVPVIQSTRVGPSKDEDEEGAFEVDDGDRSGVFYPVLRTEGGRRILVEDVAHFCRGTNPYNRRRTVTVCNGMFGRGTYGAVRALTHARFRDRNAQYVRSTFPAGSTFSILARVTVVLGDVVTPDWSERGNVLHAWSDAAR